MKNLFDEMIITNNMKAFEEISQTYMYTEIARHFKKKVCLYADLSDDKLIERNYACIRYLRSHGVEPKYIVVDSKLRYDYLDGIKVILLSDFVKERNNDDTFVIVTKNIDHSWKKSYKYLCSKRIETYRYCKNQFKHFALFDLQFLRNRCGEMIKYVKEHSDKLEWNYNQLDDEISKRTMVEIVKALVDNKPYSYIEYCSDEKYFGNKEDGIYKHLEDEVWVNCGSCSGDSVLHYIYGNWPFKKIFAYEGDKRFIEIMRYNFQFLPSEIKKKIEIKNEYMGKNTIFVEKPTLINMDIEGAEMETLHGLRNVIEKYLPVCAICCYHKASDMYDIVKLLSEISSDYHFYMRKYIGYDLNAMNEYVLYAVPSERILQ